MGIRADLGDFLAERVVQCWEIAGQQSAGIKGYHVSFFKQKREWGIGGRREGLGERERKGRGERLVFSGFLYLLILNQRLAKEKNPFGWSLALAK